MSFDLKPALREVIDILDEDRLPDDLGYALPDDLKQLLQLTVAQLESVDALNSQIETLNRRITDLLKKQSPRQIANAETYYLLLGRDAFFYDY